MIEYPAQWLRRVNLWPRLVIGASLGFLTLLVVVGLLILRIVEDSRDRILEERLVIAQMAAREVDAYVQHAYSEMEATGASLPGHAGEADLPGISDELATSLRVTGDIWLGLYLLDPRGETVAAAPASGVQSGVDPPVARAIRGAIATGNWAISSPYRDGATGKPAAMLMVPLSESPAGADLILGGVLDLSRPELVGALSSAQGLGNTGHAELFDADGLVIASTDQVEFLAPGEHRQFYLRMEQAGTEGVDTVPVEPRTAEEAQHEDGQHIMAVAHLAKAPWGVAIGGSESETLAPVNDLRNEMLLLGAATLVVLWLTTLVAARILVRPVRVLTSAADRMRAGDLTTPIHVAEGGEIGRLGETLEGMRTRLGASLEEIRQRDLDLEKRVHERTQQVQDLYEELKRKEELRSHLLKSVISAQEEERKRIARELHDETGQALTGIIMSLESAQDALGRQPAAAAERLERARGLASQSIDMIRQLVVDLRPAALDDLGLVPALRAFAETRLGERGIHLRMETSGLKDRLPPPVETCLFRVVQEAVTNIVRHSEAKAARIELRHDDGAVSLLIEDDGRGFDVTEMRAEPGSDRALGLAGMEERVALVGGDLTIESAPGKGTRIRAKIAAASGRPA